MESKTREILALSKQNLRTLTGLLTGLLTVTGLHTGMPS